MMKRFAKMLLVLLCVAVFTVGSAERKTFNKRNLTLQSPCAVFPGKYNLNSVINPNDRRADANCNFIIYDFVAVEEIAEDELLTDAARYRQLLLDSGYFEKSQIVEWLLYTGDRKIALATINGFTDDYHVSVYALDRSIIRIEMVNAFSFSDLSEATGNQKTEDKQQNTASSKSVATNNGLTILSPEQFLGIEPCDNIYREDNHYTYAYTDRGYKYHGSGTANPVDWYKMEEYVNALVNSGYYEILEHSSDRDDAYWTLRYIGPAKVKNTFDLYYGMSDQAAITLRNFIGNIKVRYSIDILTADIVETQQRLGEYVVVTPQSSAGVSGGRCPYCGGDGKCDECGGDVWYYDFDFVYVNGAPELQYVRKMCTDANCNYGKCNMCGGDGIQ